VLVVAAAVGIRQLLEQVAREAAVMAVQMVLVLLEL
jgi:hypothetical protein